MERARVQSVSNSFPFPCFAFLIRNEKDARHYVVLFAFCGLFRRNNFTFWLGQKATQNMLMCGNRLSHVSTHTELHTSMKTPVDLRQLRVTVQAACKQSKEQNWFQVVRDKREEWAGKEEQKLREYCQLLFWWWCFQNCEMETIRWKF